MAQTSVNINQDKAIVGMLADAGQHYILSKDAANAAIPYGRGVIKTKGLPNNCRLPGTGKLVITDNAGSFTDGDIETTIVYGPDSDSEVVTTSFSETLTTKALVMAAHAAAILAALFDAYSCAYDGSAHTITLIMSSEDLVSGATTVTPGEYDTIAISSATVSAPDILADVLGIAVMDHNREQQLVTGVTQYAIDEPVNVLRKGTVYVKTEEAVTSDDAVYLRITTNGTALKGNFAKSAHSSECIALSAGFAFADSSDANNVVKLEINLPQ